MSIDHLQGHFEWVTAYISNICIWFKIEILIDKIVQSVPDQDNDSRFPGVTVVADHSYYTVYSSIGIILKYTTMLHGIIELFSDWCSRSHMTQPDHRYRPSRCIHPWCALLDLCLCSIGILNRISAYHDAWQRCDQSDNMIVHLFVVSAFLKACYSYRVDISLDNSETIVKNERKIRRNTDQVAGYVTFCLAQRAWIIQINTAYCKRSMHTKAMICTWTMRTITE